MAVNSFREDEQQAQVSKWKTLTRLYRYLLAYKSRIAVVLLIMLATISINMINPLIVEQAVNVHIANRDMKGLLLLGLAAVVLNLIMVAGVKARMIMMAKLSNQVLLTIREELYVHIQKPVSYTHLDVYKRQPG